MARRYGDPSEQRPGRRETTDAPPARAAPRPRIDRIASTAEGDEEGITLRVHLGAAVLGERSTQHFTMLRKHRAVILLQLFDQLRRAVNVGEKQRHNSAGQLGHFGSMFSVRSPVGKGYARYQRGRGTSAGRAANDALTTADCGQATAMRCLAFP
jgi:hypothetical protein